MAYALTLSALVLVDLYGCVEKVLPTELAGHSLRRLGSLTFHCISTVAAYNPSFSLPGCIAAFRSFRSLWAIKVNSPFFVAVSLPLLLQLCALATVQVNGCFSKLASTSVACHALGLPSATGACGQGSSVEVLESSKLRLFDADFLGLHRSSHKLREFAEDLRPPPVRLRCTAPVTATSTAVRCCRCPFEKPGPESCSVSRQVGSEGDAADHLP